MRLSFRQGIVRALNVSGSPSFLSYNSGANTMDINITSVKLLVTLAYRDQNYLIEQPVDQTSVWGPFIWNSAWGTQPPVPNYYLYWDIRLSDGVVTYGFTPNAPVIASSQPASAPDKHWWDTTDGLMKVWDGTFWVEKVRVFAGSFAPNSQTIVHQPFGTQIGVNEMISAGYVVYGNDERALLNHDGTLVTSETNLLIQQGGYSSPVRLEGLSTTMIAGEALPAFSAVSVTDLGVVSLADHVQSTRAIGMVTIDTPEGSPVTVVTEGAVFNEQWNWEFNLGRDLFLGANGTLEQRNNLSGVTQQRIGSIMTAQSILLNIADFLYDGNSGGAGAELERDIDVIGTSVGAIDEPYTFPQGMSFTDWVELISQKVLPPSYSGPSTTLASSPTPTNTEVGTVLSPQFTRTFNQANAGALTAYRLRKNGTTIASTSPYVDSNITITLATVSYQGEVDYAQGPVLNDNFGNPNPSGQIPAGTVVSNIITFVGKRKAFYGTPSSTPSNSAGVRAMSDSSFNATNNADVDSAGVGQVPAPSPNFIITIPIGATRVVIAYPADQRAVASIKYQELSDSEVKSNFVETSVSVEGANGFTPVTYRVFTYIPVEPFSIVNHYKVFI